MKNPILITLIALLALPATALAQVDEAVRDSTIERLEISKDADGMHVRVESIDYETGEVKDTTKIMLNKSTIYIVNEADTDTSEVNEEWADSERKRALTNWAGIDIGVNGLLNADYELDFNDDDPLEVNLGNSRTFSINFYEQKIRLIKDYVGITTGAGFQWNSYRLKNDLSLGTFQDSLFAVNDSIDFRKNKLRTTYVTVPLLLEFNTSLDPKRSFHVAAGVVGGFRLGTMYKQKYKQDGEKFKNSVKNDFGIEDFKLDAMVRIGYGSLNLFASVQMNELFEKNKGPELYPFSVGLTLVAFND